MKSNFKKRNFLLPPGCKDLIELLQGPAQKPSVTLRINAKIRASKVRVIGEQGEDHGIMELNEALHLARSSGIDLVEIAPHAKPPICRIVDYEKYLFELSKRREKQQRFRSKD
jgi:translation initiation factor IF-3